MSMNRKQELEYRNDELMIHIANLKHEIMVIKENALTIKRLDAITILNLKTKNHELKQENQILIEELKEARAESGRFGVGA